eukprot:UN03427
MPDINIDNQFNAHNIIQTPQPQPTDTSHAETFKKLTEKLFLPETNAKKDGKIHFTWQTRRIRKSTALRKQSKRGIPCIRCWKAMCRCNVKRPCDRCVRIGYDYDCQDIPRCARRRVKSYMVKYKYSKKLNI